MVQEKIGGTIFKGTVSGRMESVTMENGKINDIMGKEHII